jgi:DNA-binding response OmpR family regulator
MIPTTGPHLEKSRPWNGKALVLVVEDSQMITKLLKHLLEFEGYDVLVAGDGLEGLEAAIREQPSLILADFHMPRMNGLEMVKALRADPRTHSVAILMLSGNDKPDDKVQALIAGADDYAIKGDTHQLVSQIKALLGRAG